MHGVNKIIVFNDLAMTLFGIPKPFPPSNLQITMYTHTHTCVYNQIYITHYTLVIRSLSIHTVRRERAE